jgi:hypothetical protein
LAGRRLCSYDTNGLGRTVLPGRWHADSNANSNGNSNSYSYCDCDGYRHSNWKSNGHADSDSHRYCNWKSNGHADTWWENDANTPAPSDAASSPIGYVAASLCEART